MKNPNQENGRGIIYTSQTRGLELDGSEDIGKDCQKTDKKWDVSFSSFHKGKMHNNSRTHEGNDNHHTE